MELIDKLNLGETFGTGSPEEQVTWATVHSILFTLLAVVVPFLAVLTAIFGFSVLVGVLRLSDTVDSIWPLS